MNLKKIIIESGIESESFPDLKKKIKEELKQLSIKSQNNDLSENELKRQHYLNELKDKIRDFTGSSSELAVENEYLPSELATIITEMLKVQDIERAELSYARKSEVIRSDLAVFKTITIKQARVPQITSTSIFGILTSLFLIPKDYFSGTVASDFVKLFPTNGLPSTVMVTLWLSSLIFTSYIWISINKYETEINSIVSTVGNESNLSKIFKKFVFKRYDESLQSLNADYEHVLLFSTSDFIFYMEYFFKRKRFHHIFRKNLFNNPELLNAFEAASQVQIDKSLENGVISIYSRGLDVIYKINEEMLVGAEITQLSDY